MESPAHNKCQHLGG